MWCLELVIHRVAPGLSMILTKYWLFLCVCLSFFTLDPHPPFPSENGFEKTSLHRESNIVEDTDVD